MKRIFFILAFPFIFSSGFNLFAQETFQTNGTPDKRHSYYAFINATLNVDYQTVIEKATLLVKDGIVVDAGTQIVLPKGAVVYDLKGKNIYPSLIDMYSTYGMPEVKRSERTHRGP